MNGVILLPTLNRIEKLKEFIKSYKETSAEISVWILVDDQDFNSNIKEYESIQKYLPDAMGFHKTGTAISMGDKCRFIWPEMTKFGYSWIGILNDDHYCITPEWDKKCEALIDGTNIVSTNDGYWNFGVRVAGLTAWSMPLLDVCGFPIFPRNLQHICIDDVWKNIGEATGCWKETMKINIEHRHVFKGAPKDQTHDKVYENASWAYDGAEFKFFMQQDFKSVCDRIIKFRQEHTKESLV
jgi:hypothetical protein